MKEIKIEIQSKMMGFFYYPYYNQSKEMLGSKYGRLRMLRDIKNTEFISAMSDIFIHENNLDA